MVKYDKLTPAANKSRKEVIELLQKHYDEGMKRSERSYMLQGGSSSPNSYWNQWFRTLKDSWRDISRDPIPEAINMGGIELLIWEYDIFLLRLKRLKYYIDHPKLVREQKTKTFWYRANNYITKNIEHPKLVTGLLTGVLVAVIIAFGSFALYMGGKAKEVWSKPVHQISVSSTANP